MSSHARSQRALPTRAFLAAMVVGLLLGGGAVWGQSRIPSDPSHYLQSIGDSDDGARDLVEVIFFEFPASASGTVYFGINDAGVDNVAPDDQPGTETTVNYYLVGGTGALTGAESRLSFYDDFEDEDGFTLPLDDGARVLTGTVLSRMGWTNNASIDPTAPGYETFSAPIDPNVDGDATDGTGWVYFPGVDLSQGELVGTRRYFKVVVVQEIDVADADKNAFQLDASATAADLPTGMAEARAFAYSWTFALLDNVGDYWNMFPFVPDRTGFASAEIRFRNYDMDDGELVYADDVGVAIPEPTASITPGEGLIDVSGPNAANDVSTASVFPVQHDTADRDNGTWIYQVVEATGSEPDENTSEFWVEYDEDGDGADLLPLRIYASPFVGQAANGVSASADDGIAVVNESELISVQIVDVNGDPVESILPVDVSVSDGGDVSVVNGVDIVDTPSITITTGADGVASFEVTDAGAGTDTVTLSWDAADGFAVSGSTDVLVDFQADPPPVISSTTNLTFAETVGVDQALPTIYVTDSGVANQGNTIEIQIRIPSGLTAEFVENLALAPAVDDGSGGAGIGVVGAVSYPAPDILAIDVVTDFDPTDRLIITGLELYAGTYSASSGSLELWLHDGTTASRVDTDDKVITITGNTNVWTAGDGTTAWNTDGNWSTNTAPPLVSPQDIVIQDTGIDPVLPGDVTVDSMEIQAGATLTTNGNDLTVNGNLVVDGTLDAAGGGTITTSGVFDLGAPSDNFVQGTSTVVLAGADSTLDTTGEDALNNLTLNLATTVDTVSLGSALTVGGDLTITQGTLDAVTYGLTVTGNVSGAGTLDGGTGAVSVAGNLGTTGTELATYQPTTGTTEVGGDFAVTAFIANHGTVEIIGSGTSTVYGPNTFYDFASNASGKTIAFEDGFTQDVTNGFDVQGTAGAGNAIALSSSTAGNLWSLDASPPANVTVDYVDVSDSDLVGAGPVIAPDTSGSSTVDTNSDVYDAADPADDGTFGNDDARWQFTVDYTWDNGGGDTNWDTPANWDPDGVPGHVDNATIPEGFNYAVELAADQAVNDLTIGADASVDVTGNEITINGTAAVAGTLRLSGGAFAGSGSLENNGVVELNGTEDLPPAFSDDDSGLFRYVGDGPGGATAFEVQEVGAIDYFDLEIDGQSDETFTIEGASGALTVANDLDVTAGNLAMNDDDLTVGETLTVSGSISQTTGDLTVDGRTELDVGAGVDITLDNPANDFDGDDSGDAITFTSGGTIVVWNSDAVTIGGPSEVDALTIVAGGPITDSGTLTVGGSAVFETRAAAGVGTILIDDDGAPYANTFGSVAIRTLDAGGTTAVATAASVYESNATDLAEVRGAGVVTVDSGGAITDSGTVTATGTLDLVADDGITIDNDGTADTIDVLRADARDTIDITTGGATQLGDGAGAVRTTTGDVDVTAGGALTSGAVVETTTVNGGAVALQGTSVSLSQNVFAANDRGITITASSGSITRSGGTLGLPGSASVLTLNASGNAGADGDADYSTQEATWIASDVATLRATVGGNLFVTNASALQLGDGTDDVDVTGVTAATTAADDLTVVAVSPDGGIDLGAAGTVVLAAGITTVDSDIRVRRPARLDASVTLDTGAGAGDIQFDDTINADDSATNDRTLTLNAGAAGTIALNGVVGGAANGELAGLTVTNSNGATFAAAVTATDGAGSVTVSDTQTDRTVTFEDTLSAASLSATATANAYNVSLLGDGSQVTGATTLSNTGQVTLGDAAGDTLTFAGEVSATGAAQVNLAGTLQTDSNNVVFTNRTIRVTAGATVDTEADDDGVGGAIVWSGSIVSATAVDVDLSLNTATGAADMDGGAVTIGAFTNDGGQYVRNLTITTTGTGTGADGTLTSNAGVAIAGTLDLDIGASDATMTTATTDVGTLQVWSANNVTLSETDGLAIAESTMTGTLDVASTGAINGSGGGTHVTAPTVVATADTGIGATTPLQVDSTDISADSTGGEVNLTSVSDLATTLTSVTTDGAAVDVDHTGDGNLTIESVQTDADSITITASGAGDVTVNPGANAVWTGSDGGGGTVEIESGNALTIDGELNSGDGSGGALVVNGGVTIEDDAVINLGTAGITLTSGGTDIVIGAALTFATHTTLSAAGDIIVGATVTTTDDADLTLRADSDDNGTGGVWIQGAGQVSTSRALTLTGSELITTAGDANYQAVFIAADGTNVQAESGTGTPAALTIQRNAAGPSPEQNVEINGVVNATGDLIIRANADVVLNDAGDDLASNDGDVQIVADANGDGAGGGAVTMNAGASIDAGTGSFDIDAPDDITVAGLTTTANPGSRTTVVDIQSSAGSILRAGGGPHIVAQGGNAVVSLRARGDIGELNGTDVTLAATAPLVTQIRLLDAATTNPGTRIAIANSNVLSFDLVSIGAGGADIGYTRIVNDNSPLTVDGAGAGGVLLNGVGQGLEGDDHIALVTTTSGAITVNDEGDADTQDIATGGVVYLDAVGAIDDDSAATDLYIAAGTLHLNSGVAAPAVVTARTAVGTLYSDLTGGDAPLDITEDDGLTLESIQTTGANVTVVSTTGDIDVGSIDAGAGTVTLTATAGDIDDDGDAAVDIVAGTIDLDADGAIGDAGDLETTTANIVFVADGNVTIIETDALVISGASSVAGNLDLDLNAGNLTQAAADAELSVTGTTLITTTGSITLDDGGNDFGGAVSTAGNPATVLLRDANDITLGAITTTDGGGATAIDVETGGGSITVGDALNTSAVANAAVRLVAAGQDSDVAINANVTTDEGGVTITAPDSVAIATGVTITSGAGVGGVIGITANSVNTDGDDGDEITMAADSVVEAGDGTLSLTANGDQAGDVAVGDVAGRTVNISANHGEIVEAGPDVGTDITGTTLNLDAATGIGTSGAPIEIAAATSIDADNTGVGNVALAHAAGLAAVTANSITTDTGAIEFAQTGNQPLTVTTATTDDGAITISNTGADLTVATVTAGGDWGVDIDTITSGNVTIGTITATGDTVDIDSAGAIDDDGGDADDNAATPDIAAATVELAAAAGIGATEPIEIADATRLTATTNGDVDVDHRSDADLEITALSTGTGNISFNAFGDDDGDTVSTSGNVTATTGDVEFTVDGASIDLSEDTVTAGGVVTVTTTTSGDITLDAVDAGSVDVDSVGTVSVTARIEADAGAVAIDSAAGTTIAAAGDIQTTSLGAGVTLGTDHDGSISTAGDITTNGGNVRVGTDVTLDGGIVISTSDGDVDFDDGATTEDGAAETWDVEIAAGGGDISFGDTLDPDHGRIGVNQANPIGVLTITSANNVDFFGSVFVTELSITHTGTLTIRDATSLVDTANVDLYLEGPFALNGTGAVDIAGDITTNGQTIDFTGPVTLFGNVRLDTLAVADVSFGDDATIDDGAGGPWDLIVDAPGSDVSFGAASGAANGRIGGAAGANRIDGLTIDDAANVTFNGEVFATTITQTAGTRATAFNQAVNAAGDVDLNGEAFTINGGLATTAGSGGAVTITNAGLLTVADTDGTGDTATADLDLDGAFEQDGAGTVEIAGDIATTADTIDFAGAVTLTGDVSLDTGGGADISFANGATIDDGAGGPWDLIVDAPGSDVSFGAASGAANGRIGGTAGANRVGGLTIDDAANVTFNGEVFATTITQTAGTGATAFNQAVNAAGDVDLNGEAFTINAGLTTTAGSGGAVAITNAGLLAIADTTDATDTANADLDLDGAFEQDGAGAVEIAGDITTTGDAVSFATNPTPPDVSLTGNVSIATAGTGSGAVSFGGDVGGLRALIVDSGGDPIIFGGGVGAGAGGQIASVSLGGGSVVFDGTGTGGTDDVDVDGLFEITGAPNGVRVNTPDGGDWQAGTFDWDSDLYIDMPAGVTVTLLSDLNVAGHVGFFRGSVGMSGRTVTIGDDLAILGGNYDADDRDWDEDGNSTPDDGDDTRFAYPEGVADVATWSYDPTDPADSPFSGDAYSAAFAAGGLDGATITLTGPTANFYLNGADMEASGDTSVWTLNLPDQSGVTPVYDAAQPIVGMGVPFAVAFNASVDYANAVGGYVAAAADNDVRVHNGVDGTTDQATGAWTEPGPHVWDFAAPQIDSAETVYDNVVRLAFSEPLENAARQLQERVERDLLVQLDNGTLAYDGIRVDTSGDPDSLPIALAATGSEPGLGTATTPLFLTTSTSWNTDATGTSPGAYDTTAALSSTDEQGNSRNVIPDISMPKGVFHDELSRNLSAGYRAGVTGADVYDATTDEARPALVQVVAARHDHDETATVPTDYEDYDGHNYLELRYSEPVTIGGLRPEHANTRAEETFGAGGWGGYVHDDGAGTVSVEGYFTYPGTFEGGSIDADRVTSSLYRTVEGEFNANSTHYATIVLTGFRDPAEEWIGYIESASDPGATAETIAVTANGEIEDGAASPNAVLSGSLVRHPVTVTPGSDVGRLDWDVDPPELARFRPYDADSEYHEIVALSVDTGANTDPQLTDRIELHFLDDSGEVSTWSSTNPAPPPLPRTDPSDGGIRDYLFQAALANGAFRLDFEGDETPRVFNGGDVTFDTNIVGPPENPFFEDTAGEEVDDMYVGLAIDDETVFNFPIEASLWMSYETSGGPTNAVNVITDHAGNRMEPFADRVTIERIPPRISAALAIAGTDRIYIRFSEWVYGANGVEFTDPAFNVNDYFEIVTSGGGYPDALSGVPNQFQAEFQPLQTLYRPVADKTVVLDGYLTLNTGTITQEGALDWRIVMRSSSPPIRYVEDEFTTPMSASTENRVSDVALGVVEPVAAWNSLQLEPGELEFGEEFTGLVSADQFDGSGIALADRDLTLQARIADAVNAGSPVVLYYDANVPERFLTPEGAPETPNRYWLPADSEITDDPDTPEAETIQENSDARRLLPEEIDGQFREYLIPSDDPEFNGGEEIEILLEIDGVPAARYTDANDPRSIAPWSITLQRFVEQRGGVTILNNVIYPENGEQTVVEYEVPRASMLTIHVLSLDGQLVRTLARGRVNEGTYRISWDGTNQDGQIVASGLYFVRVVASGVDEIRKVLVAK